MNEIIYKLIYYGVNNTLTVASKNRNFKSQILTSNSHILYNLNKSLTVYRNRKRRMTFIQPLLLVKILLVESFTISKSIRATFLPK